MGSTVYSLGWHGRLAWLPALTAACLLQLAAPPLMGKAVAAKKKHVIGATARLKEVSTGVEFPARIDTGAKSCSIHVDKWEIKDPASKPVDNIGKSIRFLLSNEEGDSEWVETIVASRVRIRNSAQNNGAYHGRYKVRLTLQWQDFKKEVLVTLTDRAGMEYPLLIGRNFLRDDFLVDVGVDSDD